MKTDQITGAPAALPSEDVLRALVLKHGAYGIGSRLEDAINLARAAWQAALAAEPVKPQPKSFVQERAQLEQEWCQLRAMQAALAVKPQEPAADERRCENSSCPEPKGSSGECSLCNPRHLWRDDGAGSSQ